MSYLQRLRRYAALRTYELRQAWRQLKNEALELWEYWCFRLKYRTDKGKGVGRGRNEKMDALVKHVATSDKYKFETVCKTVADAIPETDDFERAMVQRKANGRRTVADAFLRDAQREENSMRTRADCAFEACYLYAIAALGAAADGYEHPRREALVAGGEALGMSRHDISPALAYFGKRYGGTADADDDWLSFETLRSQALKMQARIEKKGK